MYELVLLEENNKQAPSIFWDEQKGVFLNLLLPSTPDLKKEIALVLGYNCNYDCMFCVQENIINRYKTLAMVNNTKNTISHLERLYNNGEIRQIKFVGGEPLLYFNTIKEATELINKWKKDDILYMETNGHLLYNHSIVDFLIENQIHTIVSHQGPVQYQKNTEFNLIDDSKTRSNLIRLHTEGLLSFRPVITNACYNYNEFYEYFESKGFNDVIDSFNFLTPTSKSGSIVPNKEKLSSFVISYIDAYLKNSNRKVFNYQINNTLWALENASKTPLNMCSHFVGSEAVDINGYIIKCFKNNNSSKIHLKDVESLYNIDYTCPSYKTYTKCDNCFCKRFCPGSCNENYCLHRLYAKVLSICMLIPFLTNKKVICSSINFVGENHANI